MGGFKGITYIESFQTFRIVDLAINFVVDVVVIFVIFIFYGR